VNTERAGEPPTADGLGLWPRASPVVRVALEWTELLYRDAGGTNAGTSGGL